MMGLSTVNAHDKKPASLNELHGFSVTSDSETLNNADVLLYSGLKLFNIIANLCFKLYYEVLLKSGNYIVNLSKLTLMFRT